MLVINVLVTRLVDLLDFMLVINALVTRLVGPLELHVGDKCSGNYIG